MENMPRIRIGFFCGKSVPRGSFEGGFQVINNFIGW